jgi:hypothetical protein
MKYAKNPYRELTNNDKIDIKRILNGNNWLDTHIENDVRKIVMALRANGVNTTCACHHNAMNGKEDSDKYMGIECVSTNVTATVNTVNQILACLKIKDYIVDAHWYSINEYPASEATVSIKIAKRLAN